MVAFLSRFAAGVSRKKEKQSSVRLAPDDNVPSSMRRQNDAIAIIGMSGRYPGARDLPTYWENLAAGRNSIEEVPNSRWSVSDYFDPQPGTQGKIYAKWLGHLEDIECFDPLFFHISPAEAQMMDPQQRMFLEESYKAFQDAGYGAQQLSNHKCGVYLGIMSSEYATLLQRVGQGDTTGNSLAIAAARIAYYLNLKGPAISVDTACSSSLVATHLACQALHANEIEMALVGGVTLYLVPESYIGMCAAGMLSPDGQCKTFDNRANGFVPGEGVGTMVLKRLSDAEAANDRIYGVIIGSGINQDGKTNGITAPSGSSQIALIREVYTRYDIHPETITYVEMHGTGTKLGDPIELEALAKVFKEKTSKRNFCAIGSVKSNIGHTTAAAGIAGVHKMLLALQHRELVPTLNFVTPNEHINFQQAPFFVNTERRPWVTELTGPRRAAVSSFGFSGTNAHVVLEEYVSPDQHDEDIVAGPSIVVVSARNEDRLKQQVRQLLSALEDADRDQNKKQITGTDGEVLNSSIRLADVAYTLQVGREAMEWRLACVVKDLPQLCARLGAWLDGEELVEDLYLGHAPQHKEALRLFAGDELQETISKWIERGKLNKLAELWVKGLVFEWSQLYGEGQMVRPRRISLPTYPFAKERYWVDAATARPRNGGSRPVRAAPNKESPSEFSFLLKLMHDTKNGVLSVDTARQRVVEKYRGGR